MDHKETEVLCSFCGKDQDEVLKLIAGPNVYICNECITLCQDIIDEDKNSTLDFPEGKYIHQLLTHHFHDIAKSEIESCSYDITTSITTCPGNAIDQ